MGKGARKLRKFFRDPRLFFYDSKILNPNDVLLEQVVSLPESNESQEIIDGVVKEEVPKKQKTVDISIKERKVGLPWVVGVVEGKIKFKSIKPAKLGLCTLISSDDSKLYEELEVIFSKGSFKGSLFAVNGVLPEQTVQSIISAYKPFSSDWFNGVKCVVSVNGSYGAVDVVGMTKYDVLRVNIIDDNTNISKLSEYDLIISFIELPDTHGVSRVEYVKSTSEVESILLDSLLSIEYKSKKSTVLHSLMDSSDIANVKASDFVIKLSNDTKLFNTFSEYLVNLAEDDCIECLYASESMISRYSSMIVRDDLIGLIKQSLIDGARYEVI